MPGRNGDLEILVPSTTPQDKRAEVEGFVIQLNNNPNEMQSFKEAAAAAGLLNKKEPPYLLIGGILIASYFLFIK